LLTGSYGFAIVIFAVLVKVILFPVTTLAHKNSIRLLQLQPALAIIKKRYTGDKERLSEEQYELFSKERYSPLLGILPLILQLFLVMGMLQVMYNPLQHLLRLDAGVIETLIMALQGIYGELSTAREQLMVLEAFRNPENLPIFRQALSGFYDHEAIVSQIMGTELNFFGLNLGAVPSFINPSVELIIPFFAGFAALAFCLVQNAISPGALSQGKKTNIGLTIFTVSLSVYFALVMPVGVGMYWGATNLAGIGSVLVLNLLYNPKKLAADAIAHLTANKKTPMQIKAEKMEKKELLIREKNDIIKFYNAKKQLVFYAISGGQYKFYEQIINYLLSNSNITIHYLTNDQNDAVFKMNKQQLIPYYASSQKTISLMLKMDTDIFITTVPDLHLFHSMKRSIVRDDIEYIYTFHGSTSTYMVYREKAFDYFDTIFCVGPHHVTEIRRREELAGIAKKKLIKVGYGLYDQLVDSYSGIETNMPNKPRILIGPSWQPGNILESCIEPMLEALLGRGYHLIVRPHVQFTRLFPQQIESLVNNYQKYVVSGELSFELDFLDNTSIFSSDLIITDWSGIAYEFAYCTLKPCVFINTPMKVMDANYKQYGLEVLDITLRDKVGVSVDIEDVYMLNEYVNRLLEEKDSYKEQIRNVLGKYVYNPGRSGEAGGKYIIKRLE